MLAIDGGAHQVVHLANVPATRKGRALLAAQGKPPPPLPPPRTMRCADWCVAQAAGVEDFVQKARHALVASAFRQLVESYPWRDKVAMEAYLPHAIAQAQARIAAGGFEPAVGGNVDALLPTLDSLLAPADCAAVLAEVATLRIPCTYLDVYESVYELVHSPTTTVTPALQELYDHLFVAA